MSSRRIVTGHKEYLAAASLQKSALIEGYQSGDGREVSPVTWKDGEYIFSITWPEGADAVVLGAEADADPEVAAWYAKAQRLDLKTVILWTCRQIDRKAEDSPLWHLLQAWQSEPPPDLYRPCVAPHTCEALGRWLVLQLSRAFAAAMVLEED